MIIGGSHKQMTTMYHRCIKNDAVEDLQTLFKGLLSRGSYGLIYATKSMAPNESSRYSFTTTD